MPRYSSHFPLSPHLYSVITFPHKTIFSVAHVQFAVCVSIFLFPSHFLSNFSQWVWHKKYPQRNATRVHHKSAVLLHLNYKIEALMLKSKSEADPFCAAPFRLHFSSRISPSICWNPISVTNNKTHNLTPSPLPEAATEREDQAELKM